MAKNSSNTYRNKIIGSISFFLITIILVVISLTNAHNQEKKWNAYQIILNKQQGAIDGINTLFPIKKDAVLQAEIDRIQRNYDLFLKVLHGKKSLIIGNDQIAVAESSDKQLNELKAAIEDTWIVVKSMLDDQKKGTLVSDKEFIDNITDLKTFHTDTSNRAIVIAQNNQFFHTTFISVSLLLVVISFLLLGYLIYNGFYKTTIEASKQLVSLQQGRSIEDNAKFDQPIFRSIRQLDTFSQEASRALMEYGYGNFDYEFKRRSAKDKLGRSIEQMRFRIKDIIDEDRKKSAINNRINQGMAKFSDILQKNSHDVNLLVDTFVTELITYFEANQGALYTLNETNDRIEEQELELQFTYAWNRKKFKSDTFKAGDNLAGQAVLENDTIYMTNVPDNYIEITSGIGKSNPNCLLIVPLKLNEQPKGVLELASFREFEKYEIELIEKLCENLASTITNTLANEKTKNLLDEARNMASAMKEQEDRMRRNQEEMQVEQEASQREISRLEAQLEELKHQKERLEQDLSQYQNA